LSSIGRIAIMALWGVILASVVNFFMKSEMMVYVVSYVAVAIFCGLTMYDVQRFKQFILGYGDAADDNVRKIALLGALSLYLDFLNLFLHLLRLMGSRK
jgi:FtsH-binding integral membrane protein